MGKEMINDEVQKQESGNDSTNLQAKSVVVNQGISYSDAKEIALDVYKANFIELSQGAAQIARGRAEELTDGFLTKLKEENNAAIDSMKEPSMQAALYEAQKQYAKTGDKDLEELLVDILVERASTLKRNIHQIVLDEALTVASKLTAVQMDVLTINFLLTKTLNHNLSSLPALTTYIYTYLLPFTDVLGDETSCYEHLEYVGCISLLHMAELKPIEQLFQDRYGGLFSEGFDRTRLNEKFENANEYPYLLADCLHNAKLLQVNAVSVEALDKICNEKSVPDDVKDRAIDLFESSKMSIEEIKSFLIKASPKLEPLFVLWKESKLSKFVPTTVGIAIAQANFRRKTGIKLDLTTWVK